jgi:hypothetical protein
MGERIRKKEIRGNLQHIKVLFYYYRNELSILIYSLTYFFVENCYMIEVEVEYV